MSNTAGRAGSADSSSSADGPGAGGGATSGPPDPLVPLGALPGVAEAVEAMRKAVDRVYGHRVMRRRSSEVSAEAALRGARASAALEGADWGLEEVRRRSDFGAEDEARTVGAALRVTAESGQLLDVWRQSPLRVLARLHLVAAGGAASGESVGRPRLAGETVAGPEAGREPEVALPTAEEVSARLDALSGLVVAGTSAPALVLAAVVHGELATLRPFVSHNGVVARAAERIVLVGSGLDPKSVSPAEVGHAEAGVGAYRRALGRYASGAPGGVAEWIAHCGRAAELGARESTAVCEAMQRGAA
ncbi:Fic family protein [Streptomyces sp. N2-109]|uniref:Fic family protein n=1 Tax=Streptomyces gossypii TaxID=2883101 RepID=A0ABT2JQZ6_9ACTN|nr:Fic family protein [Streptomyces gossypii]MCT2589909.1 Fic family protein [Streptomyces gossypii]